jgi:hydroxyacylglutathione hydrolase
MKRILIWVAVGLVVLIAVPVTAMVIAFSGSGAIVDGKDLGGGARIVKDGFVSAAVLPAGEGVFVLVDCGNDEKATPIVAELARRGVGPEAVTAILLTHGHGDHVKGCRMFPGAQIYGMAAEAGLLEGRQGSRSPFGSLAGTHDTGVRITHPLEDGATFAVGNLAVTAYSLPGHSDGSGAYLTSGMLFLGDSADSKSDGTMSGAKWLFSNDRAQNREALRRLADRLAPRKNEVKWLVFSHSGPLEGFGPLLSLVGGR